MTQNRSRGRNRGKPRGPRHSYASRPKLYKAICADCGKEVLVQVPPPGDKKLLCMECFKK